MNTFIYALCCPLTNHIRYIGKSDNPKRRLADHINRSKKETSHKNSWIRGLIDKNSIPILQIIDEVDLCEWVFWEIHYISLYKSWGFNLTNMSLGGENPPSFLGKTKQPISEETRNKMKIAQKGNKNNLGNKATQESKDKMSKSHRGNKSSIGRVLSNETKQKISLSNKGRIAPNKGIKHLENTKLKMSQKRMGIKLSDETKNRMSKSKTGIKLKDSTIIKMKLKALSRPRDPKTGYFVKQDLDLYNGL